MVEGTHLVVGACISSRLLVPAMPSATGKAWQWLVAGGTWAIAAPTIIFDSQRLSEVFLYDPSMVILRIQSIILPRLPYILIVPAWLTWQNP